MNTKEYFRLQMAAAVHFENFTGYEISGDICDLLTQAAFDYTRACEQRDFSEGEHALNASVGYVNTEMDEEGYEAYVDGFADCISMALDGCYDDEINFDGGIPFEREDEEV